VKVFGVPYVNVFLIEDGPGLALVDSGLAKRAELLLAAVAALGRAPKDLRHILITHHHEDHTGSLAALGRRTGATIYAHALDIPIVQGDRPRPPASRPNAFSRLTERIGRRMGLTEVEPAMVGHPLADGEVLPIAGGLRVLHTPGHTPGHVSLLLESRRLLFAGDAAGAMFGRVGPPLGVYTEDMAEARRSLRALAEVDFDAACFGHGGFIRADAGAAFRRAVERLDR
jgi:glyoxylase-like metal-dependent hydrolase (beta-lactamase superfamily II)